MMLNVELPVAVAEVDSPPKLTVPLLTMNVRAGDIIASAPKTSARTDFTLSYIVNASNATAGGTYSGRMTLVCTGTY